MLQVSSWCVDCHVGYFSSKEENESKAIVKVREVEDVLLETLTISSQSGQRKSKGKNVLMPPKHHVNIPTITTSVHTIQMNLETFIVFLTIQHVPHWLLDKFMVKLFRVKAWGNIGKTELLYLDAMVNKTKILDLELTFFFINAASYRMSCGFYLKFKGVVKVH